MCFLSWTKVEAAEGLSLYLPISGCQSECPSASGVSSSSLNSQRSEPLLIYLGAGLSESASSEETKDACRHEAETVDSELLAGSSWGWGSHSDL